MMVYDVCIVGAGPAGMTSALYAVRSGLSCVMVEKLGYGGQMAQTSDLQNYPGFPDGVNGFDLAQSMGKQAEEFGAKLVLGDVVDVDLASDPKKVVTSSETIQARSVILAPGVVSRKLGRPGEAEFAGHGVSYCATCDGNFFRGKDVAVIGGGNSAAVDAQYLARICNKVYVIHRRDTLRAAYIDVKRLEALENVEFVLDSVVDRIEGADGKVTGVTVRNVSSGDMHDIPVSAVFVAIGKDPATGFLKGKVDLDEAGSIVTDDAMRTSVSGVFAAGDVRQKDLRQVVTATSDGAIAAESALEWHTHH